MRVVDRLLTLDDAEVPEGRFPVVLALTDVNINGADLFDLPADLVGTGNDISLDDETDLAMIERRNIAAPLRLRRNGPTTFATMFGANADPTNGTIPNAEVSIQTSRADRIMFRHVNSGTGFSNWTPTAGSTAAEFNAIANGDRIIVLIDVDAGPAVDLSGSATTGAATASAVLDLPAPSVTPLELAGSATTGAAMASAVNWTSRCPSVTPLELAGSATTGAATASAELELAGFSGNEVELAGAATTGVPTANAVLELSPVAINPLELAGSATTGAAMASAVLDLPAPSVMPLELAGSATTGAATAVANMELPAPAAPLVTLTTITSTPRAAVDTYGRGERIEITVTYDVAVDVDTTGGVPQVPGNISPTPVGEPEYWDYMSGSGSTELVFGRFVAATDMDANGVFLYGNDRGTVENPGPNGAIVLNGGTITRTGSSVAASLTLTNRGTAPNSLVDGSLELPAMELMGAATTGPPTASAVLDLPSRTPVELMGAATTGPPTASAVLDLPSVTFTPRGSGWNGGHGPSHGFCGAFPSGSVCDAAGGGGKRHNGPSVRECALGLVRVHRPAGAGRYRQHGGGHGVRRADAPHTGHAGGDGHDRSPNGVRRARHFRS